MEEGGERSDWGAPQTEQGERLHHKIVSWIYIELVEIY